MPRPRVYKTEAVVLKHTLLGDADKILTLYTPHMGKVRAVAKGVRRTKSRLAGHVEPLTRSAMMLSQGQNLDVVSQSQTINSYLGLREDLERTTLGIYAAELLDLFTLQDDANPSLYNLFLITLEALCSAANASMVIRYYETRLLDSLGFRPELSACISCRSSMSQEYTYFSVSGGGIVCSGCRGGEASTRPISQDALEALRFLQRAGLENVRDLTTPPSLSREMEITLREYIRYLLEREVRSTGFVDTVRRQIRDRAEEPTTTSHLRGTGSEG